MEVRLEESNPNPNSNPDPNPNSSPNPNPSPSPDPRQDLLEECKKAERYEAAAEATKVLELMELTGSAMDSDPKAAVTAGDTFLQQTADEISKQARRRVQLVKERSDLEKIVEYVAAHNDTVRRYLYP